MNDFSQMRVTIVGLGQIGGSLAKAFQKQKIFSEIVGVDKNQKTLVKAKMLKIINEGTTNLRQAIQDANLVILATPVRQIIEILPEVASRMKKESILCEVGSTKEEIFGAVEKLLQKVNYIGLHPMAGTEKEGIDGADENLFVNQTFMLFPSKNSTKSSLKLIMKLIQKLKARALLVDIKAHDQIMAKVSHLPYLLSIALVNSIFNSKTANPKNMLGGSFKDATRVAQSSPEMMLDILATNRKNIAREIDGVAKELSRYKGFLEKGDERKLLSKILKARKIRSQLKFV